MPDIPFGIQLGLWGYVVLGEVIEPDACASEKPNDPTWRRWDRTLADLKNSMIDRGQGWQPVPYWYALVHLPWGWREEALAALIDGTEIGTWTEQFDGDPHP